MPFGSVSICIEPHHLPYHYKYIDKFIYEMGHQAIYESKAICSEDHAFF